MDVVDRGILLQQSFSHCAKAAGLWDSHHQKEGKRRLREKGGGTSELVLTYPKSIWEEQRHSSRVTHTQS